MVPAVRQASRAWLSVPGEGEPDQVDAWIAAHAEPFYIRA
jgi:hypothetical protein